MSATNYPIVMGLVLAVGSSACMAGTNDEPVGESKQELTETVNAGGYAGWLHTTNDYPNLTLNSQLTVNGTTGYTFTASAEADFDDYVLGSWTTSNIDACQANYAYVEFRIFEQGTWGIWYFSGNVHAVA